MPAWIPGSYLIRDFSRQVETIQAHCAEREIRVAKTGNHEWLCDPCDGPLHVDYTVYAWDLSVRGAHFDESHAFLNGTCVYLSVEGRTHDGRKFRILTIINAGCLQPPGFFTVVRHSVLMADTVVRAEPQQP